MAPHWRVFLVRLRGRNLTISSLKRSIQPLLERIKAKAKKRFKNENQNRKKTLKQLEGSTVDDIRFWISIVARNMVLMDT